MVIVIDQKRPVGEEKTSKSVAQPQEAEQVADAGGGQAWRKHRQGRPDEVGHAGDGGVEAGIGLRVLPGESRDLARVLVRTEPEQKRSSVRERRERGATRQ